MPPTDEQLIERCRNGEPGAFELIVKRYLVPIYNFTFRLSGDKEESGDMTQDVFLKVWRNLKRFDVNKSFKTWIFTVARNTITDWFRKKKSVTFSQVDIKEDGELHFEDTLRDLAPLADEMFERKELTQKLEDAMIKIPVEYRIVLILRHTEELTFKEIALILGKPLNTVASKYRRALFMIRKLLK